MAGRTLDAEFDWDDHPVMAEVRASRIDTALKLWGAGMPMRDINDYLNLGMSPYDGWDTGYLPFSVTPMMAGDGEPGPSADPANDPGYAEEAGDGDQAGDDDAQALSLRLATLVRRRKAAPRRAALPPDPIDAQFACCECGMRIADCGISKPPAAAGSCFSSIPHSAIRNPHSSKARNPRELAQWRALMAARRESVKSFSNAFGRVLLTARRETLAKIEAVTGKSQPVTRAAAADLLFDLENFRALFRGAMEKQSLSALAQAGAQLFKELGRDDPFTYPPPAAIQFLRARRNKLATVPDEIFADIKGTLEEGLNAGETMAQLSARVRATCNAIDHERATRIAMTETAAAYGTSRQEAMSQAGVKFKRWLTSGNDNVRPAHAAANGQTVPADEPFIVDGEALAFPSDTRGSPANVINCHCVAIAVAPDELQP
jgi:SPP1 gp7 family putative phage head morphogenesis protein